MKTPSIFQDICDIADVATKLGLDVNFTSSDCDTLRITKKGIAVATVQRSDNPDFDGFASIAPDAPDTLVSAIKSRF